MAVTQAAGAATAAAAVSRPGRSPIVPSHGLKGWPRLGGAILVTLSFAACGPFLPPQTPSPSGPGGSAGTSAGPSGAPAAAGAPDGADAAVLLAEALAPLEQAASITSSVTVDGAVAARTSGRSVGSSLSLRVTSGGTSIDYVELPHKAWARQEGESWVLVGTSEAPQNPLAVLADPSTVVLAGPASQPPGAPAAPSDPPKAGTSASPGGAGASPGGAGAPPAAAEPPVYLQATYPAGALGLRGEPITVTITIAGPVVTFTYAADTDGHRTVSATILKPGRTTPAIVAPAP